MLIYVCTPNNFWLNKSTHACVSLWQAYGSIGFIPPNIDLSNFSTHIAQHPKRFLVDAVELVEVHFIDVFVLDDWLYRLLQPFDNRFLVVIICLLNKDGRRPFLLTDTKISLWSPHLDFNRLAFSNNSSHSWLDRVANKSCSKSFQQRGCSQAKVTWHIPNSIVLISTSSLWVTIRISWIQTSL